MNNFACIFVVLFLSACIYGDSSEEGRERFREKVKKCKKEIGLTEGRPRGPPNFDDPKERCFHACLMKEIEKMVDGKVVIEKVLEFHKNRMANYNDEMEETVTYCVETANEQSDECDVAATLMKCLYEKLGPFHLRKHQQQQI